MRTSFRTKGSDSLFTLGCLLREFYPDWLEKRLRVNMKRASWPCRQPNFYGGWLNFVGEVGLMIIRKENIIENVKMKVCGRLLFFLRGMAIALMCSLLNLS